MAKKQPSDAKPGFVYALSVGDAGLRHKIGRSGSDPWKEGGRLETMTFLIRSFDIKVDQVTAREHPVSNHVESMIHAVLAPLKVNHEGKSPSREIFWIDRQFAADIVDSGARCCMTPKGVALWTAEWAVKVTELVAARERSP